MSEFTDTMARMAVAQAVYKAVAESVSTNSDDNLRAEFDAQVLDAYDATGAKSFDMKIGDAAVGTVSVRKTKEKEDWQLTITDLDAFNKWLLENGLGHTTVKYDRDTVMNYIKDTGEQPAGANVEVVTIPERVTGTTLRIDAHKVADAMGEQLPQTITHLLTD